MRSKILALALAAVAVGSFAPTAGAAFERPCQGTVDVKCRSDFCGIASCTPRDCLVYSGIVGDYNTPLCVGLARDTDPPES